MDGETARPLLAQRHATMQRQLRPGSEMVPSRRTYALIDWMAERDREVYQGRGLHGRPPAPPPVAVSTPAIPLPEAVRGDALSWANLPLGSLAEAKEWPLGFNGLLPIPEGLDPSQPIPGLRLFSSTRALALAGWLGGLEPVRLRIERRQLILDAGQDDSWLVTDLDSECRSSQASPRRDPHYSLWLAIHRRANHAGSSPFRRVLDAP